MLVNSKTAFALFVVSAAGQTGVDPSGILRQAFDNDAAQKPIRSQYFYRERAERRQVDHYGKPGKLNFTHDYEWVYLEGEPFRKLVAINNRPLKGKYAEEEERRMRMTAADRRAAAAHRTPRSKVIHLGDIELPVILRAMEHKVLREELIEGRKTWVIQSDPKTGYATTSPDEAQALCYRYTFWVDQEDFTIARQNFVVIKEGVEGLPGSWSTMSFNRYSKGLWFPKSLDGYFASGAPRPPAKWFQSHRFFNFRKFDSESTVVFQDLRY